jgi:hypothetical protein
VTAISLGRAQVALAVPRGSRRARDQREWLRAVQTVPELEQLRADAADRLLEVARVLARYASWGDRTTRPTRALVCRLAGISVTTWKRCRRLLEDWGLLGTVQQGTTPEFSSFLHRDDPNLAAVYVLAVPKRKPGTAQVTCPEQITGPPPEPARARGRAPARARGKGQDCPPSGRAQPGSAPAPGGATAPCGAGIADAMARVLRRAAGETVTDGWCAWLARPFAAAGYSAADLSWAIDHEPSGRQQPYSRGRVRHPAGWLRKRLDAWLAGGIPVPSRSQQLAASRNRSARDRPGWLRARAAQVLAAARRHDPGARAPISHDEARARIRDGTGDLGHRGAGLARELIRQRRAQTAAEDDPPSDDLEKREHLEEP